MEDVRIRLGAATLLSVAAFLSILGAVAVFIWWLVLTKNLRVVVKNRIILPSILLIGFFSCILELTTGGGTSYFLRLTVVILIGSWLLSEHRQGDFLNFGSWLLGNRTGFELGIIAEMGMQTLHELFEEVNRIRIAGQLKGMQWGVGSIVPAGVILVHSSLSRAEDTAELLAVRGYTCGGTRTPVFRFSRWDYVAAFFALCAALISIIPVSEFFILS
jgi:energy-coupling factor transporter transmembrane protein EcfT